MQAYCLDNEHPPRPGSKEAVDDGCTCPTMDNHNGQGRGGNGERYGWYISGGCPIHSPTQKERD